MADNFEIKIKDEDFLKMKFNINTVPIEKRIIDFFPELKTYPEFNSTNDVVYNFEETQFTLKRDWVCRYILYAYDPQSPFQQIRNINERKNKAFQKANIQLVNGLDGIKQGFCQEANDILKCFFKIINDRLYELWQTGNEFFSDLTAQVREAIAPEDLTPEKMAVTYRNKSQNYKDAIALNDELTKIEKVLFAGNEDLQKIMAQSDTTNGKKGKIEQRALKK